MSGKRWQRYRAPSVPTDERGQRTPSSAPEPMSAPKPRRSSYREWSREARGETPKRSDRRPRTVNQRRADRGRRRWWIAGAAVAGLVVAGSVAVFGDDRPDLSEVDTELLDEAWIQDGLDVADEEEGGDPYQLRVDEYWLRIEFLDPAEQELRTYEFTDYRDGYQLTVERNEYDDYRPRPFALADVDPAVLVEVGNAAIGEVDEPYSFEVQVSRPDESAEPVVTGSVREEDGEDVEVVTDLAGEPVPG